MSSLFPITFGRLVRPQEDKRYTVLCHCPVCGQELRYSFESQLDFMPSTNLTDPKGHRFILTTPPGHARFIVDPLRNAARLMNIAGNPDPGALFEEGIGAIAVSVHPG